MKMRSYSFPMCCFSMPGKEYVYMCIKKNTKQALVVHTFNPIIPTLERQRQADICDFKSSLVYKA